MEEFGELTRQERDTGLLVHLASFAGYLIPFGNLLGPLIVWLMKRDESPFVEACGRNCVNFQISMVIYGLISAVLALVVVGFFLLGLLAILNIIFTIIAAVKANDGLVYKYPLAIRFIK